MNRSSLQAFRGAGQIGGPKGGPYISATDGPGGGPIITVDHLSRDTHIPGSTSREHGNCGRLPKNAFNFETVQRMISFITNYATVHGQLQPAARSGRVETAHIYLPATEGYTPSIKSTFIHVPVMDSRWQNIPHFVLSGTIGFPI